VPLLVDEQQAAFTYDDIRKTGSAAPSRSWMARVVPRLGKNLRADRNMRSFVAHLSDSRTPKRILVVGGRIAGEGSQVLLADASLEVVETDIALGPRTAIVCDAHNLPFADESFDGVVVQAVLEHVFDPTRCVAEIHRVLRPAGVVYAETPFIQQVHAGAFDFTRFTALGHRYLFRDFELISYGAVCGPGMALAWSYQYFLLSFFEGRRMRKLVRAFAAFTAFPLKYFDHLLVDRAAALDAASATFFLGRKASRPISKRNAINSYQGAGSATTLRIE
jgi:ubiquinone/menaquinone biosynthesis C-methylase UbiE